MTNNPTSVYLSIEDKETLETIAAERGMSRHSLMQYAILYFLKRYQKNPKILKTKEVPNTDHLKS